ncbi:MAG TPA: hypothetical protein VH275_02170 [Solirubrobacterales bacterium]|nr:hypothetical protein [Solirubrobacterales bacterium]
MRNIKTLGVATAMALALIAIAGASMASANNFKAQTEPEQWGGSSTGKSHVLSLNGESITCSSVTFAGETVNKSVKDVTVTPALNGCTRGSGIPATWTMHGCKFRLHAGPGPGLSGTIDITGCETPMSTESEGCLTQIGNQGGLGTIEYKNVATSPPTLTAVVKLTGITFTRNGQTCFGPVGTFSNGTYTDEWTIKGAKSGVPAAAEIEATSPAPPSMFAAEEAPVTIAGAGVSVKSEFGLSTNGQVECESINYSATMATTSAAAIALVPAFHGCSFDSFHEVTKIPDEYISAGGCSYEVQAKGAFAIVGAGCAAKPISITTPGCVFTLGPQSGLGAPSLTNEGSGRLRTVKLNMAATGTVTATATGGSCAQQGTFTEGTMRVVPVLSAKNSSGVQQGLAIE